MLPLSLPPLLTPGERRGKGFCLPPSAFDPSPLPLPREGEGEGGRLEPTPLLMFVDSRSATLGVMRGVGGGDWGPLAIEAQVFSLFSFFF